METKQEKRLRTATKRAKRKNKQRLTIKAAKQQDEFLSRHQQRAISVPCRRKRQNRKLRAFSRFTKHPTDIAYLTTDESYYDPVPDDIGGAENGGGEGFYDYDDRLLFEELAGAEEVFNRDDAWMMHTFSVA